MNYRRGLMYITRFCAVIFSVVFISCNSQSLMLDDVRSEDVNIANTKLEVIKSGYTDKLEIFFKRTENDSVKAGNVLEKYKIIQHLTHLRKMDSGGKKYYLLEKDDITRMINSVTEGIYLDYILINKNGDIIYTNNNDDIFGTNVNTGYEESPLQKCFINRTGVYFEDISYMAPSSKIYSLYISTPVYVEGNYHGVLILQVEIKKIIELLEKGAEILSRDGIIRVTPDTGRVFSRFNFFEKIDMEALDKSGVTELNNSNGRFRLYRFRFKEINWIVADKEL